MIRVLECVVGMNRGGIETLLMELYRRMDRTRVQMDFLVSLDGVYDAEIQELGGKIYHTPFISKVGPFAYGKNLRRFFAEHPEYRIVHAHMDRFGGEVMREAKRAGVPVRVMHSHNTRDEGGLAYHLVKDYYGRFYPDATDYFACSADAAAFGFGSAASRAIVLKNGIDTARFAPETAPAPAGRFVIGHVGRFLPIKNHTFLLEIFAAVYKAAPEARLVLVGDGPLRPKMVQKAEALGVRQAITFVPDTSDVPSLEKQFDVFVMPSLFEGLGIALVEAQSCGLPCVAADTIPREADVTHTVHFLPLVADAEGWAKQILALRGTPKQDNRAKIRAAGYDISTSAAFLQDFYCRRAREAGQ